MNLSLSEFNQNSAMKNPSNKLLLNNPTFSKFYSNSNKQNEDNAKDSTNNKLLTLFDKSKEKIESSSFINVDNQYLNTNNSNKYDSSKNKEVLNLKNDPNQNRYNDSFNYSNSNNLNGLEKFQPLSNYEITKRNNSYRKKTFNNNYDNYSRSYYSATETCEESDYDLESNSRNNTSIRKKVNANNKLYNNYKDNNITNNNYNNSEDNKVSYASITLRQPLKDINYFSDTEAFNPSYTKNSYRNNSFALSSKNKLNRKNSTNSNQSREINSNYKNLEIFNKDNNTYSLTNSKDNKSSFLLPNNNFNKIYNNNNNTDLYNNDYNNNIMYNNSKNKSEYNNRYKNNNYYCEDQKEFKINKSEYENSDKMLSLQSTNYMEQQPHSFSKLSPFNKNNQLKKDIWTPSTQYKPVNSPVISYNATNNVLPLEQKKEEHVDYEKGKIYLT